MRFRKLGRTEIEVSTVCMGCWAIVGDQTWGDQSTQDALDAIRAALDAGINFFDSAEVYGNGSSEELLAKVLEGRAENLPALSVGAGRKRRSKIRERQVPTRAIDMVKQHAEGRAESKTGAPVNQPCSHRGRINLLPEFSEGPAYGRRIGASRRETPSSIRFHKP